MSDVFEKGDYVRVFVPDGKSLKDYSVFNAGWAVGMEKYIGQHGIINSRPLVSPHGGHYYHIQFSNGHKWYWDERYIERVKEVEESVFNDVFN